MNCLIYSRVSTEEQAEKGRSIGDQVRICEDFAKNNDYRVAGVFKDPGKSATNMNRPALQDMLLRCGEDGSIEAVLVQDTDRLARNPSDHLQIKALLKKSGVQVISISQPMVTGDSPESQFIDLVIAGMNQFQSQITGRKTSKVMEQKVIEGWKPGPPRIGYKNATVDGKNIIITDEERASHIKKLFEMYVTGTFSIDQIRTKLNSQGFRTKAGLPVAKSLLAAILRDPFYIGVLPYKGKTYPGKHQPIIGEALFNRCQGVLQQHNQFAVRTRKYKYLLRGVLFCNVCGSRAYAEKHVKVNGVEFDYYYCPQCHRPYVETIKIEKQVEKAFKTLQLSESFILKLKARAKEKVDDARNGDSEKKIIQNRITKLEAKRKNLEDNLLDETVDKVTYKRQHSCIEVEISQLEVQISKLNKDRSSNIKAFEQLVFTSKNIYKAYIEADPETKRRYLALFWERFEMRDGTIEKAVPTKLFKALLNQKSINPNSKVRVKSLWLPELDSNQ